jgi:hypothetical protein
VQKQGQIEIEDAVIAPRNNKGGVELKPLSNAGSFWEIRAAATGYPASGERRRFDRFQQR